MEQLYYRTGRYPEFVDREGLMDMLLGGRLGR